MALSLIFSIFDNFADFKAIAFSSTITSLSGIILHFLTRKTNYNAGKKEGFIIVTIGWIVISMFGALPYILSGTVSSFTDAFFETMSGFTTTGSTILSDIEASSKALLFWRATTQWIGGMGIIVLTIAIIPFLGIGGMQLFAAEVSGVTYDKISPRISRTARQLWIVYLILTATLIILLLAGGMSFFDAICHAFSTVATGGFSTKNTSIAYFESAYIHYVVIIFMFLGGMNFTLIYFAIKGKFSSVYKNEEFKTYVIIIFAFTVFMALVLHIFKDHHPEKAFRNSLFQVVSISTGSGFITDDYEQWTPFAKIIILILMFAGGCAGSTTGGIKAIRHLLMFKNTFTEFRRLLHPRAVILVQYNGNGVESNIISRVLAFVFIYISIFITGTIIMLIYGLDFESALGSTAATLGTVGPGLGVTGPGGDYSSLPESAKWILSFFMLVGRLELFTVLILFTKSFWKT